MTSLILIAIAGILGAARLWSLRASRSAVLTLAAPAALLPLAVAAVVGARNYRAAWERMAETGSGGLATYIGYSRDWIEALFLAAAIGIGLILLATALAVRRAEPSPPVVPRWSRGAALIAVAGIAAMAGLAVIVSRSERAALGPMVKLLPLAKLDAMPDLGYPEIRTMRNEDVINQLERDLRMATIGGTGIAVLLAVCLVVSGRFRSLNGSSPKLVPATATVSVAVLGAAIWYGLHARSITQLLDATTGS